MQKQTCQMMSPRIQTINLIIQRMRKPGEWMPVCRVKRNGHLKKIGPFLNHGIFGNVFKIVPIKNKPVI